MPSASVLRILGFMLAYQAAARAEPISSLSKTSLPTLSSSPQGKELYDDHD
jgi:hypothetical protein